MAGCGYVCPQCEGKGFTEKGEYCDWCNMPKESQVENPDTEGDLTE
jgi:hypothetical protein